VRKTTSFKPRGIQWPLFFFLEANDLAHSHLKKQTARLNDSVKQIGLYISIAKSMVMCININWVAERKSGLIDINIIFRYNPFK
jgi:hypothetical protein